MLTDCLHRFYGECLFRVFAHSIVGLCVFLLLICEFFLVCVDMGPLSATEASVLLVVAALFLRLETTYVRNPAPPA